MLLCLFVYSVNGRTLLEDENNSVIVKNAVGAKTGNPLGLASIDCTLDADFNPVLNGAFNPLFSSYKLPYIHIMELLCVYLKIPYNVPFRHIPHLERNVI